MIKRERYEHFRARCTIDLDEKSKYIKIKPLRKTLKKKRKKKVVLNHYMVKSLNVLWCT